MFERFKQRLGDAAGELLGRVGLSGEPVLHLPAPLLGERGEVRRVLEGIAASRRALPSTLDLLNGRLVAGHTVVLTADGLALSALETLVGALEAVFGGGGEAVWLFVDGTRLGAEGAPAPSDLGAALGYGVVPGLQVADASADAATLRACIGEGSARIRAATGVACRAAAVDEAGRSEVLRSELRRAGIERLYASQPAGLAAAGEWPQRRLVLGRDVATEGVRGFLDLEPAAMATFVGRLRVRAPRR